MRKTVELGSTAYQWMTRHRFISETVIISVIQDYPTSSREYIDKNHFTISFKRKKNKKFVKVTIWVEEKPSTYFVYKIHSERF